MSYIVPVHRPSGARHAIKLNFTSPQEDTLIVAKANRLEIYTQSPTEGLTLQHSRSVYGYITMLSGLRPASSTTDHLFVGTDRYQYFTCSWDAENKQINTEQSYVDQADKSLRDSKESDRCHLDPTGRYMSLELYDGVVTLIPIVQPSTKRLKRSSSAGTNAGAAGSLGEPVQIRIEQTLTRDSAFLEADPDSTENPRLAILWEDNDSNPQLCLREVKPSTGTDQGSLDLVTVEELRGDQLDLGVNQLIPVSAPYGGFLILGETSISYVDKRLQNLLVQPLDGDATIFTCWTKVDETRWLLADDYGRLFFLMIELADGQVSSWKLDGLGVASRAACLVYLDEGVVFIGSHSGDSQVVRIVEQGVEILQAFPNIAPILDFAIMDLGRGADTSQASDFSSGQARVIAASGAWQDGSIRSVRSGVGMEELGTIGEVPLITDMWAINSKGQDDVHDTLVATFVNETRVFTFDSEGEVAEVNEFKHLDLSQSTIFAANLPDNKLVQVHESGIEVTDLDSDMSLFQWRPPDASSKITTAVANGAHMVVVQGGHTLHVFHISGQTVSEPVSKTFPTTSQVSGVTIPESQSNVCIVAFWQTASVAILDLHSLEAIQTQSVGEPGRAVPRSVLIAQILPEASPTLLIAMADGTVVTFSFDVAKNTLSNMTRILLGTEPVFFKGIPSAAASGQRLTNVFASCEQPSLIYASEGRIIYSAVNADKASRICPFNTEAYPSSVAVATPSELKLGVIGAKRTTQLQTLPIGETVRCLAYEPQAKVFGMGCVRRILESGTEALMSSVKIADEVGFQELDSVELEDNELIECMISIRSVEDGNGAEDESGMFVVGTSMMIDDNSTSMSEERGRMIVYRVDEKRKKLKVMTEVRLRGACRSLAVCDDKIVAGIVKVVALYNLAPSRERGSKYSYELRRLATYRTSTNPLSIHVQPPTSTSQALIAVGDLMKSISVLLALPPEVSDTGDWQLKEECRHFATVWTSSVAGTAEHEWLLADMEGNLLMLRRNIEAVTDDDRKRLEVVGELRLGEVVNKIVPIAQTASIQNATLASKGKERSRTLSSAAAPTAQAHSNRTRNRVGPLIQPQAFIATVEGAIYMLGAINPAYIDALLRLQTALASQVQAPGYMPWSRFRAFKTEVRDSDEPYRFVDGELVESGLLTLSNDDLHDLMTEHGLMDKANEGGLELSVDEVKSWGEQLRRLY